MSRGPAAADARRVAAAPLAHRGPDGRMPVHACQKWQGPLCTFICLAEIGHRRGDRSLLPLRDQFREWLFAERHLLPPHSLLIPGQEDRFRRCACQEGFQAWSEMRLGIADDTTEELIRRLKRWQWPDGGWNCDKRPEARPRAARGAHGEPVVADRGTPRRCAPSRCTRSSRGAGRRGPRHAAPPRCSFRGASSAGARTAP
jgi:hypothetical protein